MTNRMYVTEPVAASTLPTTTEETTQPDAQRPVVFADGTNPAPKLVPDAEMLARGSQPRMVASGRPPAKLAEGTAESAPAYRVPPELAAKATMIGETWSVECVKELRAANRTIAGGWPGTLREARRRVLAAMPRTMDRTMDPQHLEELAKITNLAARKAWETVSEPDLEP
jgi:hypothetical protein